MFSQYKNRGLRDRLGRQRPSRMEAFLMDLLEKEMRGIKPERLTECTFTTDGEVQNVVPEFDPYTHRYTVYVSSASTNIGVDATAEDGGYTEIEGIGAHNPDNLQTGSNNYFDVKVISRNMMDGVYKLQVIKEA